MAALNPSSSLLFSRPLPKSGHYQPRSCNLSGFRAHRECLLVKCDSAPQNLFPSLGEYVVRAGVLVFVGTSLFFSDPAIAFKGGGPYGVGVTRGQDLSAKDFSGKSLIKQDFKTSILRQASFKGANLLGASFFDADLTGASVGKKNSNPKKSASQAKGPLAIEPADLMAQRATETPIRRIHLASSATHISNGDYTYVNKSDSMGNSHAVIGADLSDADLRGADLSLANFTKANLSNANLEGALATGNTSFRGSNITGADFTDVPLRDDQREYLCKVAEGVNPTTGNATRETLLCN